MNTQNVNVKTATRESSKRWGEQTSNTKPFSNTEALIAFSEIESQLLVLASQDQYGMRQITDNVGWCDDAVDRLADRFWDIVFNDNYHPSGTVREMQHQVSALGYKISHTDWEFHYLIQSGDWMTTSY